MNEDKHAGRRPIKGKLWGCSHNLSQAGKKYLLINKEELTSISSELHDYSLEQIYLRKNQTPPEFLNYTGYWILPTDYYKNLPDCELKQQMLSELQALKPIKNQQMFFAATF